VAKDAAGNADQTPATHTWTVEAPAPDTTAPETAIATGPAATTTATSATFTFSANETSSFACSLDGALSAACTSPMTYPGPLGLGAHTFEVVATDTIGNVDPTPASHAWAIEADCGTALTLTANADAWIQRNSPLDNKGTDSILKVQSKGPNDDYRALIGFDLPNLPVGCEVASASLELYAPSVSANRTLEAVRVTAAWLEGSVNWTNQPATPPITDTVVPASVVILAAGDLELDVQDQVAAMYAEGLDYGFLLRDSVEAGTGFEQQIHSREKGTDNPPQLVLRFAPAPVTPAPIAPAACVEPCGTTGGTLWALQPATVQTAGLLGTFLAISLGAAALGALLGRRSLSLPRYAPIQYR
jgi:large repetitive protein